MLHCVHWAVYLLQVLQRPKLHNGVNSGPGRWYLQVPLVWLFLSWCIFRLEFLIDWLRRYLPRMWAVTRMVSAVVIRWMMNKRSLVITLSLSNCMQNWWTYEEGAKFTSSLVFDYPLPFKNSIYDCFRLLRLRMSEEGKRLFQWGKGWEGQVWVNVLWKWILSTASVWWKYWHFNNWQRFFVATIRL